MALERMDVLGWRNVALGVYLDLTTTGLSPADLAGAEADFVLPFRAMAALEAGTISNPDEHRQVGHYWLRTPELAPEGLDSVIDAAREATRAVAAGVHRDDQLRTVLVLGIGGSALGPQFVSDALAEPEDRMRVVFLDNSDPDGFARVLGPLDLEETLVVCISKSGATAETRNALLETQAAYARAEIPFEPRAVAVTGEGSALWKAAEGWRARLPMWDWVGGRTSLASAVGLLPMWLQGIDADQFLAGAAAMDEVTRLPHLSRNPAALLALAWHHLGNGRGGRDMVMLPYRDRLLLLSRYLQQLVMESIGKEKDLAGNIVNQGLTVYGNKGSTDQHAYVQQLREGPDDYFATFIGVLDDGYHGGVEVDPGLDAGDYLQGFLLGTRKALSEGGHPSLTLLLSHVDAFHIGALVALYERAVGLYAFRINVNAYNQPGVEAGKKAAAEVVAMKPRLLAAVDQTPATVAVIAERAGITDFSVVWYVLMRLGANGGVRYVPGVGPWTDRFAALAPG